MKIKKNNLYFMGLLLLIIVMFIGLWVVRIDQNYYSAFITADGNKSEALEEIDGLVYTSQEMELLQPWLEAVDSFHNSYLVDTVTINAVDGAKLNGYYYDLGADTTVIVLHDINSEGNGDFLLAPYYAKKGYNLLMIDSRGFGDSEGSFIGYGFFEKNDLKNWIQYVLECSGSDQNIILHGEGMGAATAVMYAGEELDESVKFIVAQSVYSNMDEMAEYLLKEFYQLPSFPIKGMIENRMQKNAGYTCEDVDVSLAAKSAAVPAIFISGSGDTVVPSQMSEEVYDAYVGEKSFLLVEEAQHDTILPYGEELCTEEIDSYINKYIN